MITQINPSDFKSKKNIPKSTFTPRLGHLPAGLAYGLLGTCFG